MDEFHSPSSIGGSLGRSIWLEMSAEYVLAPVRRLHLIEIFRQHRGPMIRMEFHAAM
ncbi:MAG: hypothetical protein JSR30_14500 [Proteobacteria bacterium]|nr:hypothetical protein [Pseudomonadota bacterium]